MGKTLLISWLATTLFIFSVTVGSPIRVTRDLPAKGVLYLLQEPILNATITAVCEVIPECNVDTLTVSITILDGAQIIGKQHLSKSGKHYKRICRRIEIPSENKESPVIHYLYDLHLDHVFFDDILLFFQHKRISRIKSPGRVLCSGIWNYWHNGFTRGSWRLSVNCYKYYWHL